MQIVIHRGTHEIGGSCVEIRTRQTKILLDVGMPLDFEARTPEEQEAVRRDACNWAHDVDAIFISHSHADHHGLLPYVDRKTAIYATAGTVAMMHVAEVNHVGGDGVCRHSVSILQRNSDNRTFVPVRVGDISITACTVDHAAYDACAFLVEAEGRRILYSGDIRRHGVKGALYRCLPTGVDCLLLEGTNLVSAKDCRSEAEICALFCKQFHADVDKLHYIWCSGQNIDRIVQIYRAALTCSRKLIVDTYVAYVLEMIHRINPSIPSPLSPFDKCDVFRYFALGAVLRKLELAGDPDVVQRLTDLPLVDMSDVRRNPGRYAWIVRPSMLRFMRKAGDIPSVVVTSLWEGYETEEQEFMAWIQERGFRRVRIHTSGHADVKSLQAIVRHVAPRLLIPIHTTAPERFVGLFPDCEIRCPQDNETIAL